MFIVSTGSEARIEEKTHGSKRSVTNCEHGNLIRPFTVLGTVRRAKPTARRLGFSGSMSGSDQGLACVWIRSLRGL